MGEGSCHMANNGAITQMKSHYAANGAWYVGKHSLLSASNAGLQLPFYKLAVWVREAI